jgi:glycosyl transferase family 25
MGSAAAVQILIISLGHAGGRRRLMQAQLDSPGMPPHRFLDAVDGAGLTADEVAEIYDDAAAKRRMGDSLTRPEIGCAASHLAAYRHIVANRLPLALVLEDDALLGLKFLNVLDQIVPMVDPSTAQAILLCHVVRYSTWGARRVDKVHRLCRPYEAYGAHGYLITLAGAQAMLSALPRVRTVADDWRYFTRAGILEVSALVPYVVGTSPIALGSQIGEARYKRAAGSPFQRWLRKYLWHKFLFQILVKPALRLHRAEQTW